MRSGPSPPTSRRPSDRADPGLTRPATFVRAAASGRRQPLHPQLLGSLLIVTGGTFAGVLGPLARLLYDAGMTPFAFVVWRGLVAGAILWLIVLVRRRTSRTYGIVFGRLPRRERLALIAFVVTNILLNTSLFIAFDRVPIAIALLTFYSYPALLAVYGRVTGTESLTVAKVSALGIALLGLGLVVSAQFDPSSDLVLDPLGFAMALVASVTAAAWVGFGRACPSVPAEQAMGLALTSTVVVVGTSILIAGPLDSLLHPIGRPESLLLIAFTGLISGAGAAVLFTMGIRLISRVRAGVLGLVEPIVGVITAGIVLGELLTPIQLIGGALVLAAAVLIQRASDDPAPVTAVPEPVVSTAE
jgi:drug/metabolite transporter (DMT)-like permease